MVVWLWLWVSLHLCCLQLLELYPAPPQHLYYGSVHLHLGKNIKRSIPTHQLHAHVYQNHNVTLAYIKPTLNVPILISTELTKQGETHVNGRDQPFKREFTVVFKGPVDGVY